MMFKLAIKTLKLAHDIVLVEIMLKQTISAVQNKISWLQEPKNTKNKRKIC